MQWSAIWTIKNVVGQLLMIRKRSLRYRFVVMSYRRLLDLAVFCILAFSIWFFIHSAVVRLERLIEHRTVEELYKLDKVKPGEPVDKELLLNDDSEELYDIDGEHFDTFELEAAENATQFDIAGNPPLPSNISIDQEQINYIASALEILLVVSSSKKALIVIMVNLGPRAITSSNWYIVFCHMQTTLRKEPHFVGEKRLRMTHVDGNIFILTPTKSFKLLEPGERISFPLGVLSSNSDVFPNWYVSGPGLKARIILSTAGDRLQVNFGGWTNNQNIPLKRYTNNLDTSQQVLTTNEVHVVPTPKYVSYAHKETFSIGHWADWAIMYTAEVVHEAQYLSKKMGDLPFSYDRESNCIQMVMEDIEFMDSVPESARDKVYRVSYDPEMQIIVIQGVTPEAVFYGTQTFIDLITYKGRFLTRLPAFDLFDWPSLPYRGLMLDVARSFVKKNEVLRVLETMAMYKLNVLHLHLTDDQGWRLEIPGLEELTKVGSRRLDDMKEKEGLHPYFGAGPHGNTLGSGYYTVQDYKEILQYANRRHIKVIPEIDTPGHGHAAIISMRARKRRLESQGQPMEAVKYLLEDPHDASRYTAVNEFKTTTINPCLESTFTFLKHVFSEIKKIHQDIQPLTMLHVGGDEVPKYALTRSPVCEEFKRRYPLVSTTQHLQQYFMTRIASMLKSMNVTMQVWADDAFKPVKNQTYMSENFINNILTQVWKVDEKEVLNLANLGYKVILSEATHLYFDHKHEADIEERGFHWAADFISIKKPFYYSRYEQFAEAHPQLLDRITGIEGALWGETLQSINHFYNMLYPRVISMAERAWHVKKPKNNKNETHLQWNYFANLLSQKELYRLERLGIDYYIPAPGVKVQGQKVYVNTALPGLDVLMSADNKVTWNLFSNGTEIPEGIIYLATRSVGGKRLSRSVRVTL